MNFQHDWSGVEWVIALIVMALVLFWEFRFQSSRLRSLRLSLWFLIIIALACLYLQPVLEVQATQKTGIIVTAPLGESERDSTLRRKGQMIISNAYDLPDLPYSIDTIRVIGDGMEPTQLSLLEGYQVDFRAAKLTEGIAAIRVPDAIERIPFEVTGDLILERDISLTLIDPEGKAITQEVGTADPIFQFNCEINTPGLFTYQLLGTIDEDTVFTETLPVEVKPAKGANLLMIGAFPSFEWNYLKNHLSDLGFGVASRFQLSQDIYHTEFLNLPAQNLKVINRRLLEQFKLVIIDGETFAELSRPQKSALFQAVELAETGLFLMINELAELQSVGPVNSTRGEGEVQIKTDEKVIDLLKMPFNIQDRNWTSMNFQKQQIGANTQRGIGKIGFSMIANSHVLELQGARELYAQLWDQLLSPIIGFEISESSYYMPQFHFTNQPSDISFSYFGQPEVLIDGELIPAINSPIRPDLWQVTYWPKNQGWHGIQVEGQKKTYFFVHASDSWTTLQRFEKQQYNRLFFATNIYTDHSDKKIEKLVSKWISFAIFLMAITGLWLERKLS